MVKIAPLTDLGSKQTRARCFKENISKKGMEGK